MFILGRLVVKLVKNWVSTLVLMIDGHDFEHCALEGTSAILILNHILYCTRIKL